MNTNRFDLVSRLLVFLGGRPEDMEQFFAISGVHPSELRSRLADKGFQDGLLDYMMTNEPLLLAFCEETGDDPAFVARVAQSSGMDDSWA